MFGNGWIVPLLAAGLFFGILLCFEVGYRLSSSRGALQDASRYEGLSTIEAAILALLGLLLGFAFAGAMTHLDARRALIVREATAISTAYLRLDLLNPSGQHELRLLFREYLEARIEAYSRGVDVESIDRLTERATRLQRQIWDRAVDAVTSAPVPEVAANALWAINDMIDTTTARTVARATQVPSLIVVLLFVVALASAVVAGYANAKRRRRSPLHMVMYAAAVAVTVYVVLDLDNPLYGFIRLEATERILRELHDSIR